MVPEKSREKSVCESTSTSKQNDPTARAPFGGDADLRSRASSGKCDYNCDRLVALG